MPVSTAAVEESQGGEPRRRGGDSSEFSFGDNSYLHLGAGKVMDRDRRDWLQIDTGADLT